MDHFEIERKFLVDALPDNLDAYEHARFVQGYLSTAPVVRVRREGDDYFLTYKGRGTVKRVEYNLPLTAEAFEHLLEKADGIIIEKERYRIPLDDTHTAELDIFMGELDPLKVVEVEFESIEEAESFTAPGWFGKDVTEDHAYANSTMSINGLPGGSDN